METYNGHVRSPADAIILFEACRLGLLPRVQRRLSEKERQSIKSGSIFVWDEREAGMRRWTDGKSWSASRVSGSFLTYREMEGKRGGGSFAPPIITGHPLDAPSDSDSDGRMGEDGPDGYRYKPDGLMKQSFSITTSNNQKLHLISYFARSHPTSTTLNQPSNDPQLKHIRPAPGMYPESTVHEQQNVPVVTQRPMMAAPYSPSQQPPMNNGYSRGSMSGPSHQINYGLHSGSSYGWPPSPVSTPPTSFPQAVYGHPSSLPLPSASISQGNPMPMHGSPMFIDNLLPAPPNQSSMGSPMGYDRSPLSNADSLPSHPSQRGSMSSPRAMHLLPQASPRMPYIQQGSSSNPAHDSPRFSSPATSISGSFATRSSSRPSDPWDAPSQLPAVDGSSSPGSKSLDVQDIPNDKLGFNEDMRALRQLDRAFIH